MPDRGFGRWLTNARAAWHLARARKYFAYRGPQRPEAVERAISHFRQAIAGYERAASPEDVAIAHAEVQTALRERTYGDRAENLDEAMRHAEAALSVFTSDAYPVQWARIQGNLANLYTDRTGGDAADNIEQAIARGESAAAVLEREGARELWAITMTNLSLAYSNRLRGDWTENLERSIACGQAALGVLSRETHPDYWANAKNNLAKSYVARIVGGRAENQEKAIELFKEALRVFDRQTNPVAWVAAHMNLANVFRDRLLGSRQANLAQAIEGYQNALTATPRNLNPQRWAMLQANLGLSHWQMGFSTLASSGGQGDGGRDADQAIEADQRALEICTLETYPALWAWLQNNLGLAYSLRARGIQPGDLRTAAEHYQLSLGIHTIESFPAEYRRVKRNLGDAFCALNDWEHAHQAYTAAIEAGGNLLAQAYTEAGRGMEVTETSRLYPADAYALVRLERLDEALVRLEQGKTRLLGETFALASLAGQSMPAEERLALGHAIRTVTALEARMRHLSDSGEFAEQRGVAESLQAARAQLNRSIDRLRAGAGESDSDGLSLAELLELIPVGGALVAPLFSTRGSAVFVVPHGRAAISNVDVIRLDDFTAFHLLGLLMGSNPDSGTAGASGWLGMLIDDTPPESALLAGLDDTGRRLWTALIGPVVERLRQADLSPGAPLLFIPQGGLSMLPVHAAWTLMDGARHYLIEDYTLVYAPSANVVRTSRRRAAENATGRASLLAVVDATDDLPYAQLEGRAVMDCFADSERRELRGPEATVANVVQAVNQRTDVHFACHGRYDWDAPLRSGLRLASEDFLTLADFIERVDLSYARLVVLSACETGVTDLAQGPDEYVGLPAGVLRAGAPGVVCSLWPVNDLSTMLLMRTFYSKYRQAGRHPAAALREAQVWLMNVTNTGLSEVLEQVLNETEPDRSAVLDTLRKAFARFTLAGRPDARPFAHPYYWAGFQFHGA